MRAGGLLLGGYLVMVPRFVGAGEPPQIELGIESLYYRTTSTPLNRGDVLGLNKDEDLLRGTVRLKESAGEARFVFGGFVERRLGAPRDGTRWRLREAYGQYGWGSGLSLRVGKQRIAWGSGFAWNPTNRVEPAKNPLNTALVQEGVWAARMDWVPAAWAGVILVAAHGETRTGDLPFDIDLETPHTAAVRARFLVKDTDLALVYSGGKGQRTLVGFDLGRAQGPVAAHVEAAVYRGAEMPPARDGQGFVRLTAGLLWTRDDSSASLEYFYNGEGYSSAARAAFLAALATSYAQATDPRLSMDRRSAALLAYSAQAGIPYSGGLGLRRHYLQTSWTRALAAGRWTLAARGLVGLGDGGLALTPGFAYAPRGDLAIHVDAVVVLGPEDSEFRLSPIRSAVHTRLRVLF